MSKQFKCEQCGQVRDEVDIEGWFELDKFDLLEIEVDTDHRPNTSSVHDLVSIYYKHFCSATCLFTFLRSALKAAGRDDT